MVNCHLVPPKLTFHLVKEPSQALPHLIVYIIPSVGWLVLVLVSAASRRLLLHRKSRHAQLRITRSTKKGWIPWQQQSVATSKLSCMMTLTSQQWTLWIFSPERTRWILAMLEESLLTSSPLVMTFLDLLGTFLCLLCYTKTKTHYNKSASYSWLSNSSKSNTASYRGLFTAAAFVG